MLRFAAVLLALGMSWLQGAAAASLDGDKIRFDVISVLNAGDPELSLFSAILTVEDGAIEIDEELIRIDIESDALGFQFFTAQDLTSTAGHFFFGPVFSDLEWDPASVLVGFAGGATNIVGLSRFRVLHEPHTIGFNLAGLSIQPNDFAVVFFDLVPVAPIPLPPSVLLLGAPLIAVLVRRRGTNRT